MFRFPMNSVNFQDFLKSCRKHSGFLQLKTKACFSKTQLPPELISKNRLPRQLRLLGNGNWIEYVTTSEMVETQCNSKMKATLYIDEGLVKSTYDETYQTQHQLNIQEYLTEKYKRKNKGWFEVLSIKYSWPNKTDNLWSGLARTWLGYASGLGCCWN